MPAQPSTLATPQGPDEHGHHHGHDHGHGHDHDHDGHRSNAAAAEAAPASGCHACTGHVAAAPSSTMPAPGPGHLLRIPSMDCAVEEAQIRRVLEGEAAIRGLRFDLPARVLAVDAPEGAMDGIESAIRRAGFELERVAAPPSEAEVAAGRGRELRRLVAALLVAAAAEALHLLAPQGVGWTAAGLALAALAIGLSGLGVFRKGLGALMRGQLNINALMSVAVLGAFVIGQWPEAAMVMALYSLAEMIEARSVERARRAIEGLLALSPQQAEVRRPDGSWARIDAKSVAVGAIVRVGPGERLPLDGRVTEGRSAIDQASVTGESIPVDKGPGDPVFAGTVNQNGSLAFEVTHPATDTVLARIIHAVEQAQSQRAPTQRFVDRFAAIYTPAVFVLGLGVALAMPLAFGWPWLDAIYKALVLLVVACPCALVISTPVTVVSGLSAAARRGILIKGGVYLEQARRLGTIALDKTGTLTEGRPRLVAQELLVPPESPASGQAASARLLRIAMSLAQRSDHPVSRAVASGLQLETMVVDDFAAEPGRGVQAHVQGERFVLGNHRWIHERGLCTPELEARMRAQETQGRTISILASEVEVLALFAVADTPRATSRQAVAELAALGVRTVMLTGDNQSTAEAVARQVGIDEVRAELLPQDKQDAIRSLAGGPLVGMVGDGVNDSPSLAAAAVGFSLGGAGADTAQEAADVLIMNDDLRRVPETIRLSRRTYAVLWQNILLALGIKAVFMVLAFMGLATMWMAVFADMGATLIVVANGLRLLRAPVPRVAPRPGAQAATAA